MEGKKNPGRDGRWGDAGEEERGCQFYQSVRAMTVKEASSRTARSAHGSHQWKADVRVLWGDGGQQQPYQRQQKETVQELPQLEKQVTDPKLTLQGEGSVNSRENQAHSPAPREEVPSAGTQSSVPAPYGPGCPPPSPLGAQSPSEHQEDAGQGSVLSEESKDGTSDEEWDYSSHTELAHEYQREAEPELSQGDVSSSQDLWEDDSEPELRDLQETSMEEDNNSTDLPQHSGDIISIFSFGPTPLLCEDDKDNDWDGVSVLELQEGEGRAQRLPGPVPQEAWAEGQAPQSLCASLTSLYSQGSVGQQWPEAWPQSLGPALHSRPGASAPQPGAQARRQQPAALSKRPGRLRRALRALRALLCWPCRGPQPQE